MNNTIRIQLEDGPREVPRGCTLAELVDLLGHRGQAVTTAVDGQFVPRSQWAGHGLHDGAVVLLFKPIVGG